MSFQPIRFVDPNKDRAQFFGTLRQRVDAYFRTNNLSKHANSAMKTKAVILISAYVLPFVAFLVFQPTFWVSMGLWAIMGFSLAGIGMSVMHDANHGAFSTSHKANYLLGLTLNMLGGSVFNWKIQHNLLHHTYTNIVDMDDDIDDKAFMRFSPHTETKWYHKLQFIYAFFFYGLTTIYWFLIKDFIQFARYTKEGVNKNTPAQNRVILLKMIFSKVMYFVVVFIIPIFLIHVQVQLLITGFLLMHFIAGVVLTVIFQLAHTVEGTTHPLPDESGTIENSWAIHQMHTTVNFSRRSRFISWYVGGLNFQVEHHLFPTICHVHYPAIAPIVKATAEEFGVPYLENQTFMQAIGSHIRTLRRFGKLPDLNEAIA